MTRRKPPSRLVTEAHKIVVGPLKVYLHIDRTADGRVEHIRVTPSGKTGSHFQELCQELSRLICIELQTER